MKKVLGKGLESLIPEKIKGQIIEINIQKIAPNKYQPRKNFDDDKIKELATTIKEKGLFQPIVVTQKDNKYMIIAGERRWRAAKIAGLKTIPCIERDITPEDSLTVSLIENIQRENLSPIEEASAYVQLSNKFSMTQSEIAHAVGKNRSTVANMIRIISLPKDIIELIEKGGLSAGHSRAILSVKDVKKQKILTEKIVREKLTVREAESIALIMLGKKVKERKKNKIRLLPEVKDMENKLENVLGTKVRIKLKKQKKYNLKGSIEIEFYSMKDFDRLADIICGKET